MSMKLYLASGNAHKAQEFQALADAGELRGALEVLPAAAIGGMPRVEEDTGTFAGNAAKKARALWEKLRNTASRPVYDIGSQPANVAQAAEPAVPSAPGSQHVPNTCWVLADDSGWCVDTLNGGPGVESA
jgi:XTP/dITP diphosphohydrolase